MLNYKKNNLELTGDSKKNTINAKSRFCLILFFLFFGYFLISLKIITLSGNYKNQISGKFLKGSHSFKGQRADIVDRNGIKLATSLIKYDLTANPKITKKEKKFVAEKISKILPEKPFEEILKKLESKRNFVYLARGISPKKLDEIMRIGEPSINSIKRYIRHYPHQEHASHILGAVNVDGKGIKGVEKEFNDVLKDKEFIDQNNKLHLSIDINLQKILDEHLKNTIDKHNANGGSGIILDVKKAEILAMNSLPQFNPNKIEKMNKKTEFNNATLGVYELGSLLKSFTAAIALDKKILNEDTIYDARKPLIEGKYTIHDYKPKKRKLTFKECILYSSNICLARVGLEIGEKNMKEYYKKMNLTTKPNIEIPEVGDPLLPNVWRKTNIMTMSYGHGVAISPLQFVNAFNSIINNGQFRYSSLIKNKYSNNNFSQTVVSLETSKRVRKLLREVVKNKEGSGDKAEIKGYSIGGKTGTAIKNKSNRYIKNENISSFVSFFPSYDPEFIVFIMVDDPKPIKETFMYATGGWVAAPTVKKIINQMIPRVGLEPELFDNNEFKQQVNLKPFVKE